MMYNEFLDLSGKQENYISYSEYTESIEPIYMNCDIPSKQDFVRFFNEIFEEMVYPVINRTISNLSIEDKLAYIYGNRPDIEKQIKSVDAEARQLAYKYMRLYLGVKGE